ncbi:MAG: ethanolamine utilization protein EutJ [Propionibacteriaceae bacterium]|jgi:ethanolamine utilization protein EutJ|nr:ethanolamine utilization protein EutJ [Propionibacteriaceae bacterium]
MRTNQADCDGAPAGGAISARQLGEQRIRRFAALVRDGGRAEATGELRLGVDLGTANIVLAVVDAVGQPVAGAWEHSTVVRDGIVVDYLGASRAVRSLLAEVEGRLQHRFKKASLSVPPGVSDGTVQVFLNVVKAANLDPDEVVDEPVAAARVLGMTDGCVIDIGHGTTGVSILEAGRVVKSIDEATGGHHMTLVLAGATGNDYDSAERLKQDPARADEVFGVVRPTLMKMASIAEQALRGFRPPVIYLVGGASSFDDAVGLFADRLGQPVIRPAEPMFVTPLGVPMRPTLVESSTCSTQPEGENR